MNGAAVPGGGAGVLKGGGGTACTRRRLPANIRRLQRALDAAAIKRKSLPDWMRDVLMKADDEVLAEEETRHCLTSG